MTFVRPVTLRGRLVTLAPLRPDQQDGLVDAVRDGELWNLWYTSVPRPEEVGAEIERRLALQRSGSMLPFTASRNDTGAVIGMTTYMNIDAANRRLEIGSTITRLGAKQDGVLRNHARLPDGSLRDTVVYSVLDTEWPAVRNELRRRLAADP